MVRDFFVLTYAICCLDVMICVLPPFHFFLYSFLSFLIRYNHRMFISKRLLFSFLEFVLIFPLIYFSRFFVYFSVYNPVLYQPLINALCACSHSRSVIFLGLTRLFAKAHFFQMLLEGPRSFVILNLISFIYVNILVITVFSISIAVFSFLYHICHSFFAPDILKI